MLNRLWLVSVVVVITGCTSGDNERLAPATPAGDLVRVDQEQPGDNCPYGGVAIHTGVDSNSNGALDDSEITATQYVCNGATIVRCTDGGMAISGSVTLHDAADFAQLENVSCVDGDLIVAGVSGELPSLPKLVTVTGEVVIAGNPDVTTLSAFSGVRNIGQSYLIQGNDALTDISQIATLDNVVSVFLIGNNALTDLSGLASLNKLGMKLTISNNRSLTSLHGLEGVSTATTLAIRSNTSLTDITALADLRSAGQLEISGNAALADITLPSLEKLDVRLLLNQNPNLLTISLPELATLSDGIQFSGNPRLASISAPSLLATGTISFENDTSLVSIDASALAYITVDLNFTNLSSITQPRFPSLTAIGGTLRVYNVGPFTSFTGFEGLTSVGSLWITQATGLADFTGLHSLRSISGDFTLAASPDIASFQGLDQMTEIGGNVVISGNQSLPAQVAHDFVNSVSVDGAVTIN